MNKVKTAISIDPEVLRKVQKLANITKTNNSAVIELAIKNYIRKLEEKEIQRKLDKVYGKEEITDLELTNHLANTLLSSEEQW